MIDFDAKPVEKTAKEKEFDSLLAVYREKFGVPYGVCLQYGDNGIDDAIADIQKRLKNGVEQPDPDYEPDSLY